MDRNWKSVSKIPLDLPWQPARAGRQEEREGKGGKRERGEGRRGSKPKKGEAGPATMTSRACDGEEWEGAEERGRGGGR